MSDPHLDKREIDPFTGHETTGHEWGPIRELNTPFPKIALFFLILAVIYSIIAWILLPSWPWVNGYTKGTLGLDQGEVATQEYDKIMTIRQGWETHFADPDFAAIKADKALMADAMPAARRLFDDNCAACHGRNADGGPGFPSLHGPVYLWSGEPDELVQTITHGINDPMDEDTRVSEMASYSWLEPTQREALAQYVAALPSGKADNASEGAALFAENCESCHGEKGVGGMEVGAPSLVDHTSIYGQDVDTVRKTLFYGRHGVMPGWQNRLSAEDINLLALYVTTLNKAENKVAGGAGE